jgi:hypothetical protein
MRRRSFLKRNVGAAVAAVGWPGVEATGGVLSLGGGGMKAGFGRIDLGSSVTSQTEFRTPLEAVCAVLASGETTVVLISVDLISPSDADAIRKQVGDRLGIPAENVQLNATHVHSAPWAAREGGPVLTGLPEALASCAAEAAARAAPVRIRAGVRDVGKGLSINRRADVGPELGVQTFWFGFTLRGEENRPDASALVREMRSRWLGKAPDFTPGEEPVWFDGPVDPLVSSLAFIDSANEPVGCLVRFSAHPHLADHCVPWRYDADFPGVVRREVGGRLGCPVMYLTGACGDLVPKERLHFVVDPQRVEPLPYAGPAWWLLPHDEKELLGEIQHLGRAIAEAALGGLEGRPARAADRMAFATDDFPCPLDPNLPKTREERAAVQAALVAEYDAALRQGNPVRELRGLANRLNWCRWSGDLGFDATSPEERAAGEKELPLAALALGSTVLVFMHSEVMVETTLELRRQHPDLDLWTMGLTNADVGYLPTSRMIDEGGYEGRSTVFAATAEERVRDDVNTLLRRIGVA